MEGGRERLSWRARNGGDPGSPLRLRNGVVPPGEESRDGRCGDKSETSEARSAFGQTSYIEDAGGCARREDNRNEDRRLPLPFISGDGPPQLTTSPTTAPVAPARLPPHEANPTSELPLATNVAGEAREVRARSSRGAPIKHDVRLLRATVVTARRLEGSGTSDPAPPAASPHRGRP